ncbi:uncharacterized protein LOC120011821 isoform X2 [Tripterygium wilfordii]|uniref:uncharacterized protein LOC120011821 isoform X2 n=1 Tax=Tripterygium wilfordii TaxID=458696 RepID=UPI0018F80AC1|nr:uncharacterized protein LOC120011821 isoform X2 [Tripterygium wilfordii]
MVFNIIHSAVYRRLVSLLQPLLEEEPELELNLGFINSYATARNLRFNTSALNGLFEEPARFSLVELTVEEFTVHFSNWSFPAFSIDVVGVNVTIEAVESSKEERRERNSSDAADLMKKTLSEIDPEGGLLHDILERILATGTTKNWFKTSFWTLILNHCYLQMLNITIKMRFPIDESSACFWDIKELKAKSQDFANGCLFGGLAASLFLPLKESLFVIDCTGFEFGYAKKNYMKHVLASRDLFTCIKLNDLQPGNYGLHVPELDLSFSPEDLSVLTSFVKLTSKEVKFARSGRQLWKLAANRMGCVTRLTLHKLVGMICLWLRYVHAYQDLLSLVGYSSVPLLQKSTVKMSRDRKNFSAAKHKWDVFSNIEKELPAESIAQARRVARHRAVTNIQNNEDNYEEFISKSYFEVICTILLPLVYMWKVICLVFRSILRCILSKIYSAQEPKFGKLFGVFSESCQQHCFLNLGRFSITLSPPNTGQNANEEVRSHTQISDSSFFSFRLSIDPIMLTYVEENFEQSLSISFGQMNVSSSSVTEAFNLESGSKKRQQKRRGNNFKTILWGEPAERFPSQTSEGNGAGHSEGTHVPFLKDNLEDMWLRWERACLKLKNSGMEYSVLPFFLCEVKNSLTHPEFDNTDSGFCKCILTLGKLNLALERSSILSIALLAGQIQHSLDWTKCYGRASVLSHPPQSPEDQKGIGWDMQHDLYANQMKMAFLRMLPEKHIQFCMFVVGPCIQMSMGKARFSGGNEDENNVIHQSDFHLVFDVHNVEVVIQPTSKSGFKSSIGSREYYDAGSDCFRLQEPEIIHIPKSDNEKYSSQGWISLLFYLRTNGLDAYSGVSADRRQSHFFEMKPLSIQLSSFREYAHSFCSTVIAYSAALFGTAMGFTFISYMDELYGSLQVVAGLFSDTFDALHKFDSTGYVPSEELTRPSMFTEPAKDERSAIKEPLISHSTLFSINGSLKLKSADVILHKSKISIKVERTEDYDALTGKNLVAGDDWPSCGMWVSVEQTCAELSIGEGKMEILLHSSGIQSVIFRDEDHMGKSFDHSVIKVLLRQSHNCLYEISLSCCTITVSACLVSPPNVSSSGSLSNILGISTSQGSTSDVVENFPLITQSENSPALLSSFVHQIGFASNTSSLATDYWMLVNVTLGEVFAASCLLKNVLLGAHQTNKLLSSLSVRRNFQSISWQIKGGFLFLEVTALAIFRQFLTAYLLRITDLLSAVRSAAKHTQKTGGQGQEALNKTGQATWELLENLNVDVSQFSFVLLGQGESGGVVELVAEVDGHINLESTEVGRKFIFDLSRLSICSQALPEEVGVEIQMPQFSSVASNELSPHSASGVKDRSEVVNDGSSTGHEEKYPLKNCTSEVSHSSDRNHLLKHLGASIVVEQPKSDHLVINQVWVGSGSVSGFDTILSLSEIRMFLSIVSFFAKASGKDNTSQVKKRQLPSNERIDSSKDVVPNGALVVIQDVHQHMYFTVEGEANNYSLVGSVHYSLAGEKALFRVKHHTQRIWKSSVLWFSLSSLYAKSASGEPLRLNCHPGSGFLYISGTDDSGRSLWRILSCETEGYKGDINWEPYNQWIKDTFYLVNKKNDCAVAFVDGIPEFVKKPGHPFKFKVFNDLTQFHDLVMPCRHSARASRTGMHFSGENEDRNSGQMGTLLCVEISIDNVALTIVDEFSDTRERFPLLRGSISDIQLHVQILSTKTRIVSTSRVLLNYFDSQINMWRELVHPVEFCLFYRYRFQVHGSQVDLRGVPLHFYCRSKGLDISITELSLDVLLFTIGKLNLAGPFSVKSSKILANCCKVENQSGLNLLCYIDDKQSVTISRNQSASISLRNSVSAKRPEDTTSAVMIKLSDLGSLSTSAIQLSLLEARALAWRTRIMSLQGSGTYPGPFVVVDILRKYEDVLSIVVSPLIRIHNETKFSMELRFRRPEQNGDAVASVSLKAGDTIDDSMATFGAIGLSGGLKKALLSLSVGNFLFSFRPEIKDGLFNSVEWSDELKGGKAVRISGILDKLSYEVRRALSGESVKHSLSTAHCTLKSKAGNDTNMHFLIQSTQRNVPMVQPDKSGNRIESSPIALQEQREIFLLPTVRVSNLLRSDIYVVLTETDVSATISSDDARNQAVMAYGSTVDFYANPAMLYFTVTLTAFSSSCKPVSSGDWVKKLGKRKSDVSYLDIDLDFGGGKYFASLRLSRGERGLLEAAIYTPYSLKNETDLFLYIFAPNQRPLSRDEAEKIGSSIPPELGLYLPPESARTWFLKSHKVLLKLLDDRAFETRLDLDALSGLTEISLEIDEGSEGRYVTKLGMSLEPILSKVMVPSQTVTMVPRHVVLNESVESIIVRQCYLQDEMSSMISIGSKQGKTLRLQDGINKRREFSLFENLIRKHRNDGDSSLIYIQFRWNESDFGWSGPVCIASLGHFFLKFRRQPNEMKALESSKTEFAAVHVVEEGSTLVVHFHKPPNISLPYRIENHLNDVSLTFYQKDSAEQEVLRSGNTVFYAWDDMNLPRKLVVLINGMNFLREINLDKVRSWKSFLKRNQKLGIASHLLLEKKVRDHGTNQFDSSNVARVGYEVYAEGTTRVLRICEFSDIQKGDKGFQSFAKFELRVPHLGFHLLEHAKQDANESEESYYAPIVSARLGDITLDSLFTDHQIYNKIDVESININPKWKGAPFASMLRRRQLDSNNSNACMLKFVFILLSTNSNVRQVKFSSIALQPVDLNLDEETLMKIASFWRTSLGDSNSPSQQYYFDHFEVLPVKIIAKFLPVDSYLSYNSAQETLRSLLHSVVKVPPVKNMVVELNGVLVTHALITIHELCIRCARHYSWYAMRAIYIAKGSPLLPPAFASIFDDLASSSLDVFFDPSRSLLNLPGFTLAI